jgi:glycosyltransferase involved in cell wall biosynthesis
MSARRKRVCVLAFQEVISTIHVLHQIYYLAADFDLTVIGHGIPDPKWRNVVWHPISEDKFVSKFVIRLVYFAMARLIPSLYERWYWNTRKFIDAYHYALRSQPDAIHANNWQSLPIAVEVARRTGARVVFHTHEFAELERESDPVWRFLVGPAIHHFLTRYTSDREVRVDASITINEAFAERYRRDLGIDPIVVYNAPKRVELPEKMDQSDPKHIRLIYHGSPQRARGIETLVKAMALVDKRFSLDLMLMNDDPSYIRYLKKLANQIAPGRVFFREPVAPFEIVRTISEYDIGIYVIKPLTYNFLYVLPNKFFEYIQAGLAVCIGPSPAMAAIVERFGLGVCSAGIEASDVVATLNRLTVADISGMREAARRAAANLNADITPTQLERVEDCAAAVSNRRR